MSKRKESRLLVDTLIEEEIKQKKQRRQNSRAAYARSVNYLEQRKQDLEINIQNLEWDNKKLENGNRELKIERKREEAAREKRKIMGAPSYSSTPRRNTSTEIMYRSLPSPDQSTVSTPIEYLSLLSPPSTPQQAVSQLPLQSSYEPFLRETEIRPRKLQINAGSTTHHVSPSPSFTSQYPEHNQSFSNRPIPYVPAYVNSAQPRFIPLYIPGPIQPPNTLENNPIQHLTDRSAAYWRRFEIDMRKLSPGKHKIQNPEDHLWFQVQTYQHGRPRVRLNGKWWLIEEGCKQEDH